MKLSTLILTIALALPFPIFATADNTKNYEELVFLKTFAGKNGEFVQQQLGEPDSIVKKENASGTVEFWLYHDLVKQGTSDKLYRFTQIGIVNNLVETLGHTNREPK